VHRLQVGGYFLSTSAFFSSAATSAHSPYADLENLLAGQSDAKSRKELAAAYSQLGELTGKIGDGQGALEVYRKALALRRELAAAPGADVETRLDVASGLWKMGRLLQLMGNAAEARVAHEEQRDLAERLEALAPIDAGRVMPARAVFDNAGPAETIATTDAVRAMLANAHHSIGNVLSSTAKFPEALDSYRKALAIYQKLADANPGNDHCQQCLAGTYTGLGVLLSRMGKWDEAMMWHREALAIKQKLADANPGVTYLQDSLALAHNNIGIAFMQAGKHEDALASFRNALAIFQKLAKGNPAVTRFQAWLANIHINMVSLLSHTGKPEEALPVCRDLLAISQKLADATPTVPRRQLQLASVYNDLGRLLARLKRFAEAFTALDTSQTICQKLAAADPKNTENTNQLGFSHAYRGWALVQSGQAPKAATDLRRAVELWAKETAPNTDTRSERSRVLALLAGLGGETKSGVTTAEAAAFADQAVAALRDVMFGAPVAQLHGEVSVDLGWIDELKGLDFDAVRGRPDFQKLVAQVEAKAEKPLATAPLPRQKK
jgi:tetratricopeptide (TPR) repeat protein